VTSRANKLDDVAAVGKRTRTSGGCFVGSTLVWCHDRQSGLLLPKNKDGLFLPKEAGELEPWTLGVAALAGGMLWHRRRRRKHKAGKLWLPGGNDNDEIEPHPLWLPNAEGTRRHESPPESQPVAGGNSHSRAPVQTLPAAACEEPHNEPSFCEEPSDIMNASAVPPTEYKKPSRLKTMFSRLRTPLLWLVMLACLLPAGWRLFRPLSVESASQRGTTSAPLPRPIRDVEVGQRIAGRNPVASDSDRTEPEPTPQTHRKVVFRMNKPDGERIDFALLWPLERIEQTGAAPGTTLRLDMAELGGAGVAEVLRIEPCPPIPDGPGSVVTGKFVHTVQRIVDLKTDDGNTIGTTPNHPFWSEDRQQFLPAGQLQPGETVRTLTGTAHITSITPRDGPFQVYNLTVHGEHVYHVGPAGVLVHNKAAHNPNPKIDPQVERAVRNARKAPNSGLRNPNSIRFSQDSVRGTFSDGRSVRELTEGLRSGAIKPTDVPAVRLVERQGKLISIDNRRLQAFRDAGVDIPTRMATPDEILEAIENGKFSAGELGGDTIRIRGGG